MQKLLMLIVVGSLSFPLMAQETTKSEIFAGYQYLHLGGTTTNGVASSGQRFNGWNGSLTYNFSKYVGAAGDFGGGYATVGGIPTHIYTFAGGPVVSPGTERRVNPFAHALFGLVRAGASAPSQGTTASVSQNGFTMLFGGGLDVRATKAISLRLVQADWFYYHFGPTAAGPATTQRNNVRISIGFVYRFTPFS